MLTPDLLHTGPCARHLSNGRQNALFLLRSYWASWDRQVLGPGSDSSSDCSWSELDGRLCSCSRQSRPPRPPSTVVKLSDSFRPVCFDAQARVWPYANSAASDARWAG